MTSSSSSGSDEFAPNWPVSFGVNGHSNRLARDSLLVKHLGWQMAMHLAR
eukprot:CAMPEP_0119545800 /NCGR_PEP_ID=MMETSP1352-20130426/452_1 /TAXON_ID=265584 /ORGANISM="Stauroneis constricta, Strain CCMP1120" /LENGTH=49 /DNA_ID= /DNA_START= /DNA_END= /DNA_ORIENTATION=